MEFKCKNLKDGCFYKNKKGEIKICHLSPCELNLLKFGTHRRIISYYLDIEDWSLAFNYFDDLTSGSNFECDIDRLYEIKNTSKILETKDYPLGCRIFVIEADLRRMLNLLLNLQKLNKKEPLSSKGVKIYNENRTRFKRKLQNNLELLKHVVKDKKIKHIDSEENYQKLIKLYMAAFEARSKGLKVEDGLGTFLDKAFDDLAKASNLKTKDLAEFNKLRVKKAEKKTKLTDLKKEIIDSLKENKNLTPEIKKKLKEFGIG